MNLKRAIVQLDKGGYYYLLLEFDTGQQAFVYMETAYKAVERKYGVFLGDEFEDQVPLIEAKAGRFVKGHSADHDVMQCVSRFVQLDGEPDIEGRQLWPDEGTHE